MRAVKGKNTTPELTVRRKLHALGLRFRLHRRDLPGTPDIVLPGLRTVIFVHGCFWHRHANCKLTTTPKTRLDYWLPKFSANVDRDKRKLAELNELGWRAITIWECEAKNPETLNTRLRQELNIKEITE